MPTFKCKMCGGNLEVTTDSSVVTCEYCGTSQTISKSRDEIVSNLYNRANDLRLKCEFDRAEQIYEKILEHDNTETEAHWGIVLCRYGIEYIEDPITKKRIPTCHRTSYESIVADTDYISAIKNADDYQKAIYEAEAKTIDSIQKDILAIAKTEAPFDVFICYKETDENGKRTVDSAIANDIYYQLTNEGFKVFYAPITLEDKLGQEYEPYIFSALNSAKVMLVVGTKPEHFNAVWVRNEWSRYLKLLKNDRTRLLVPCYRDMDAYELPEEFAHLQAQDMSKIGFINDLVRGIKKAIEYSTNKKFNVNTSKNSQKSIKLNDGNNLSSKQIELIALSGLLFIFGPMLGHNIELYIQRDLLSLILRAVFAFLLLIPIIQKKKSKWITIFSFGYIMYYCYNVRHVLSYTFLNETVNYFLNLLAFIILLIVLAINNLNKMKNNIWTKLIIFLPIIFISLPYFLHSFTNGIGWILEDTFIFALSQLFLIIATFPQKNKSRCK